MFCLTFLYIDIYTVLFLSKCSVSHFPTHTVLFSSRLFYLALLCTVLFSSMFHVAADKRVKARVLSHFFHLSWQRQMGSVERKKFF